MWLNEVRFWLRDMLPDCVADETGRDNRHTGSSEIQSLMQPGIRARRLLPTGTHGARQRQENLRAVLWTAFPRMARDAMCAVAMAHAAIGKGPGVGRYGHGVL